MPNLAALGLLTSLVTWEVAQPPYGPPVAQACQTIEAAAGRSADHNQDPVRPPPTWPVTIDDAEKASRSSCGTPEQCRAEQREYYDLRAQWQAAEAAKGQESLALCQTVFSIIATIIAAIGTWLLIRTLKENRRAADAAADAAKAAFEANLINREAMLSEQRPWIAVSYEAGGPLEWTADGCKMHFVFWLENVGKTPAIDFYVYYEVILVASGTLLERQAALSNRVRNNESLLAPRGVIFPGKKTTSGALVSICSADLDQARLATSSGLILPGVIGCVDYKSTDNTSHQTGFIFQVMRAPVDNCVWISPETGDIPKEQLFLLPWPEGNGRTY